MKFLNLILIFFSFSLHAAIDFDVPNDRIKFGDGTITNPKIIEFSMGLGASNPIINSTDGTGIDLNVPLSIGSSALDSSAILQLNSTTQGFAPPRMTTAERDLIGTPLTGLMIINSDTGEVEAYSGSAWETLVPPAAPEIPMDNVVINSNFELWQRATSISNSVGYSVDRFASRDGSSSYSCGRANSSDAGKRYKIDCQSTTASNSFVQMGTQIEYNDFIHLAGKVVSWEIRGAAKNLNIGSTEMTANVYCNTAEDTSILFGGGGGTTNDFTQDFVWAGTSNENIYLTFTIPASCKSLFLQIGTDSTVADTNNGDGFTLDWFALYEGDQDKEFRTRGGSQSQEIGLAQRYYEKSYQLTTFPGTGTQQGAKQFLFGTTTLRICDSFKIAKRVNPTRVFYASDSGTINTIRNRSTGADEGATPGDANKNRICLSMGITANQHYAFQYTADSEF